MDKKNKLVYHQLIMNVTDYQPLLPLISSTPNV
jgi:hypothetical protein